MEKNILRVRDFLHPQDPYKDFDPTQYPEDIQGWGSDHQVFELLVDVLKPRLIIEVGTWKGRSALNMAKACEAAGLDTEIVCVDTWLGSPGLYINQHKELASLRPVFGYPTLYHTFLSNVVRAKQQDRITPFPMPSTHAAAVLAGRYKADLIYIDAAHDYASVMADLQAWWPLLRQGGVMFGDDYVGWTGVTQAVNEFGAMVKRPVYGSYSKFIMPEDVKLKFKAKYSLVNN